VTPAAVVEGTEGPVVEPRIHAGVLFRLLTPRGPDGAVRTVIVPGLQLRLVSKQAAQLAAGELLVIRTHFPRTVRRILERHGLRAFVYGVAPSVTDARVVSVLPPSFVPNTRPFRKVLSFLSTRAQAPEFGAPTDVAVLATREGSPGQWLAERVGLGSANPPSVSVRLSWRGAAGGATALVRVDAKERFVKIAFDDARRERLRQEHAALATLAVSASGHGVIVPEVISLQELNGMILLTEDAIAGRTAASVSAEQIEEVFERIAAWLATWHRATLVVGDSSRGGERNVVELAQALDLDRRYVLWLEAALTAMPRSAAPSVAVHGDLTMWNLLVARGPGTVAVIDWEDASAHGAPLSDLFYAAVDAELSRGLYDTRLLAFDAVFPAPLTRIGRTCRAVGESLGLDAALARLCFHETWLRHAANEAHRADGHSEFGELVHGRLAVEPERYPWRTDA
jgi:hypothetical protein